MARLISREYGEFLRRQAHAPLTGYERACNTLGSAASRMLPLKPWQSLEKKYQEAMAFSHLRATPQAAFSLAVLSFLLILLVPVVVGLVFAKVTAGLVVLSAVFAAIAFYYLYDYPVHYSIVFRIKASSEMVLAVLYMSISMRISANIENAVKFAARNLKGPLAADLRQLIWDVYMRKYNSMSDALDVFITKWKVENREFTEAIYLIKTSMSESTARRNSVLDEAVRVVLDGTRERMKHYAQQLRTPVTVLNAMGIMLPLIGLVFLPLIGLFMTELFRPAWIVAGYNVLLPMMVYWMMKSTLEKRPYSFHQPDISRHPEFRRKSMKDALVASLIPLPFLAIGISKFIGSTEIFSDTLLYYSLLALSGVVAGIVAYCLLSTRRKLKIREEIVDIETGFTEALFQIGKQLKRGMPIEKAIENFVIGMKDVKVSKMFEEVLYNINTFGMTFEQAVFDREKGAIRNYPSQTVDTIMHAIIEVSKRGMDVVSDAMLSISSYLKDANTVEEDLKDMLSETTSTMSIQSLLLAPLTSGIVVAVAGIMMRMLLSFEELVEKMQSDLYSSGPAGFAGGSMLESILNINRMIPVHYFQLIVGVYMIEVVSILAIFMSKIQHGEEDIMKRYSIGKMLAFATAIYAVIVVLLYSVLVSIMPTLVAP